MQQSWLTKADHATDPLADDVVIEMPFARPGRPRRIEGRDQVLAFFGPQRAAFPVRFEEVRNIVIHDTSDPEIIVVEYELAGTVLTTGHQASAPFIGVLRVRDGKIALWREYQNTPAIDAALGHHAALLAADTGQPDSAASHPSLLG
jgi:ketosteroid isomerase-like protein